MSGKRVAYSDCISRQDVIELCDWYEHEFVECEYAIREIAEDIRQLPFVNPKQKIGHWIRTGEDGYCSICHCDMPMYKNDDWKWEYTETNFCPNCGMDMRQMRDEKE